MSEQVKKYHWEDVKDMCYTGKLPLVLKLLGWGVFGLAALLMLTGLSAGAGIWAVLLPVGTIAWLLTCLTASAIVESLRANQALQYSISEELEKLNQKNQ